MTPQVFTARHTAAAAMAVLCAQAVHADIYQWNFAPSSGGAFTQNDRGGAISSINAAFDDAAGRLSWDVQFSDRISEGFYLVLTDGLAPSGRSGQFGVFYFDAYDTFDADPSNQIKLTAYAYNGRDNHSSWRDGDPVAAGDQSPDCIKSAMDASWIIGLRAADNTLADGREGRTMGFTINTADLISHSPLYNNPGESWKGTGFAESVGVRLVPAEVFEADYTGNGEIEWLGTENEGGLDGVFTTIRVPAPAAATALFLAVVGLGLSSRRRALS